MKGKTKIHEYNHLKIEKTVQQKWQKEGIYKTEVNSRKPGFYILDMFPYPSGQGLHVGHPRGYIGSDVFARFKRMQGFNVLHPMGFDAFGLPAEQYAIQTGKHPSIITNQAIKRYKKQLEIIGFSYDWSREIQTIDPEYYKWTQVIFLKIYNSFYDTNMDRARHIDELVKLFQKEGNSKVNDYTVHDDVKVFSKTDWKNFSPKEKQDMLMKYRLAYEGHAEVNWCKELGTVLANDEVLEKDGKLVSERGDFPVEKKLMRQWFMRISAYGHRLLSGLDNIDFPESTKEIQKNWIGKSEGSEITFQLKVESYNVHNVTVFTTRADTLFGVTYVVLAPEHPLVVALMPHMKNREEVEQFIEAQQKKTTEERQDTKEKIGIQLHGVTAINPANGEELPVWIANYVLMNYGTGAVMAVPAHDERDYEFAQKYNLPIKGVIDPNVHIGLGSSLQEALEESKIKKEKIINLEEVYVLSGTLINSGKFTGLTSEQAKKGITKFVGGKLVTKYKMRDAIFARQRYWGEPIPLIHDKKTGLIKEVPLSKLPLKLPNVKSYKPSGTGESPLASVKSWVDAGYETNTMPGWAGSSWYFLRYLDPKNKKAFVGDKTLDYWSKVKGQRSKVGLVDMYVGGSEHATGHLLYARFWNKVLFDLGLVKTDEPFQALRHQGMIGGADGRKMSKRWGNVVNPDDVVKTYGADTLRVFEMFLGPFEAHLPWSEDGILGSRRFVERVWRVSCRVESHKVIQSDRSYNELQKILHKTIKKVTEDIESFNFNTAVSAMMICLNEIEKQETIDAKDFKLFLQILAPFASHVTEALWQSHGEKHSIHLSAWPAYDPKLIVDTEITLGVQVNGKVRGEVTIAVDADQKTVEALVAQNENVQKYITGPIKKFIYISGKIISIVV
jgi:leucyl-tRNA synthetase